MATKCSTVMFYVCLAWLILLEIAKFSVGGYYSHGYNAETICRDSTNIPIYLLVSSKLPWALKKLCEDSNGSGRVELVACLCLFGAYVLFYFIWLILATIKHSTMVIFESLVSWHCHVSNRGVWIYPYFKPVIIEGHDQNCDASFLMFAVFAVTSDIVLTIILICFLVASAIEN